MLCFCNTKDTIFVSRIKYTFVLTGDCKSCSPARQLNPRISVTSTQSRHFFYRELHTTQPTGLQSLQSHKTFFFNERNRLEHCLRQRLLQHFKGSALLYHLSRHSFTKEMIKSIDGFNERVIDHYSQ